VKFDGCDVWDPRHPLLEAKGPSYEALLSQAMKYQFHERMMKKAQNQALSQAVAARDHPIEWHIAEPGALGFFDAATSMQTPPIALRQTLPR
jgi:hypothetical protein